MNIQDTSLESFLKFPMGKVQREVLNAIGRHGPLTNHEIARIIGRDASTVSGVNVPLRKKGLLEDAGRRTCTVTGNECHAWALKPMPRAKCEPEQKTMGAGLFVGI